MLSHGSACTLGPVPGKYLMPPGISSLVDGLLCFQFHVTDFALQKLIVEDFQSWIFLCALMTSNGPMIVFWHRRTRSNIWVEDVHFYVWQKHFEKGLLERKDLAVQRRELCIAGDWDNVALLLWASLALRLTSAILNTVCRSILHCKESALVLNRTCSNFRCHRGMLIFAPARTVTGHNPSASVAQSDASRRLYNKL